jgi:predicted RNA-binding Zn-ribbon protein involved in translation (DUF1610 family)
VDWFQCFNCRKLTLLEEAAKPVCPACGSTLGEVINSRSLEQATGHCYKVVLEVIKRAKRKPRTS